METTKKTNGTNSTTKLPSTTTSRGSKGFTSQEICAIIKECQGLGTIIFKYRDLHIEYRPLGQADALTQSQIKDAELFPVSNEFPKEWKEQATLMDQRALIEAEETQLQIENPLAYEQAQIDAYTENKKG